MKIYHITQQSKWEEAKIVGSYAPRSLESEGFIHCSTKEQVLPTANRRFVGKPDLVLLVINPEKINALNCGGHSSEEHRSPDWRNNTPIADARPPRRP